MMMKCRTCKREYRSEAWKKSGTLFGWCSVKCKADRKIGPVPKWLSGLTDAMSDISRKEK